MKSQNIDNDDAKQWKWFAAKDAREQSQNWQSHYTQAKQRLATRLLVGMQHVWRAKDIFLTYRQTKITVKIDGPIDFNRKDLRLLEDQWEKQYGVTKKKSKQGFIYSLKK